jgi:hypothetical protein
VCCALAESNRGLSGHVGIAGQGSVRPSECPDRAQAHGNTLLPPATQVHIKPSNRDTGLTATYTFAPLTNLVYTRDQQITTCR